jgi:hypothetical protein
MGAGCPWYIANEYQQICEFILERRDWSDLEKNQTFQERKSK